MKSLKDVKPGDKIFVLNSNRGYLKEPQIEILTANKVGILYIYTDYDKYKKCNSILFLPTSKALDSLNPKDAIEANAINFFNESCQALGILVDLNKKRLATCKKCGKTNKECFPTTIEEYDMYIEMLCENCLTEILDKKITAIKPKKIE